MRHVPPYAALAAGYDAVMDHVDYGGWAAHVHALLSRHDAPGPRLLELAGGTGRLARHLQPMGPYRYLCTDGSAAMVRGACRTARAASAAFCCARATFPALATAAVAHHAPFDAAVCCYDSVNYLRAPAALGRLFARVAALLRPGGVFVFDHVTPRHGHVHGDDFHDTGTTAAFSYRRTSAYDPSTQTQRTVFTLTRPDGTGAREVHVQRLYAPGTVAARLAESPLQVLGPYDGFTTRPAHDHSLRVHWAVRRPT